MILQRGCWSQIGEAIGEKKAGGKFCGRRGGEGNEMRFLSLLIQPAPSIKHSPKKNCMTKRPSHEVEVKKKKKTTIIRAQPRKNLRGKPFETSLSRGTSVAGDCPAEKGEKTQKERAKERRKSVIPRHPEKAQRNSVSG